MTSGRRDLRRAPDPVSFMQRSLKRVFKSLLGLGRTGAIHANHKETENASVCVARMMKCEA